MIGGIDLEIGFEFEGGFLAVEEFFVVDVVFLVEFWVLSSDFCWVGGSGMVNWG